MKNYSVSIQYGHFVQIWNVEANNEKEAWDKAESHGKLMYQTAYEDIYPMRNYVTERNGKSSNTISKEKYDQWFIEAIELGMTVDGYCGLPFSEVY